MSGEHSDWIGVDLDRTLAYYEAGWADEAKIGDPIPLMAGRVRVWLAQGIEVRIVTARVSKAHRSEFEISRQVNAICNWTEQHFGQRLTVTSEKDYNMCQLWDDLAIAVEPDTGRDRAAHMEHCLKALLADFECQTPSTSGNWIIQKLKEALA